MGNKPNFCLECGIVQLSKVSWAIGNDYNRIVLYLCATTDITADDGKFSSYWVHSQLSVIRHLFLTDTWSWFRLFFSHFTATYLSMKQTTATLKSLTDTWKVRLARNTHIVLRTTQTQLWQVWRHSIVFASNCWRKVATSSATSSAWTFARLAARLPSHWHSVSFCSAKYCS